MYIHMGHSGSKKVIWNCHQSPAILKIIFKVKTQSLPKIPQIYPKAPSITVGSATEIGDLVFLPSTSQFNHVISANRQ